MEEFKVGLKKVAVFCYIFNKDGSKALMLKRNKEPHVGRYIPVGGKLEPFEDPYDCVRREIFEETGIVPEKVKLMGITTDTSPTKFNWVNYVFTAQANGMETKVCPEGGLEWVNKDKLIEITTNKAYEFAVEQIFSGKFFCINILNDADINLLELKDNISGKVLFKK